MYLGKVRIMCRATDDVARIDAFTRKEDEKLRKRELKSSTCCFGKAWAKTIFDVVPELEKIEDTAPGRCLLAELEIKLKPQQGKDWIEVARNMYAFNTDHVGYLINGRHVEFCEKGLIAMFNTQLKGSIPREFWIRFDKYIRLETFDVGSFESGDGLFNLHGHCMTKIKYQEPQHVGS